MKMPFRFHRGELNGFFLLRLAVFLNYAITDIADELCYWASVQFKTANELTSADESPMRDSDILGIGKFAGVFPYYLATGTWFGMVYFTVSHIVSGIERSERGLYNRLTESFDYVHTAADDYPDDIVVEATANSRMTLVPSGQAVVGYVRSDEQLYDVNGDVIWAHVYATPPAGVVSEPFYGEKFLTMSDDANVTTTLPVPLTKALIEAMQRVRYNGQSMKSFFDITELLCGDAIYDVEVTYDNFHYVVNYRFDESVGLENKLARFSMWQSVVAQKFKLFELSQRVI